MMPTPPSFKPGKHGFTCLTVLCGKTDLPPPSSPSSNGPATIATAKEEAAPSSTSRNPPPELSDLVTAGQIEVQFLEHPTADELRQALETSEPEIVHFHGRRLPAANEIGPLELADCRVSSPELIASFFTSKLPELVYFEISDARKLGEVLHNKGVPYVVFWRNPVKFSIAGHFRRALVAVLQSSAIQVWNAFQLANASFQLHCDRLKARDSVNVYQRGSTMGPVILGDPPSTLIDPLKQLEVEEEDNSRVSSQRVQIYDVHTEVPLLVCADPSPQDDFPFKALEDGLNALLTVEVKGIRVLNRVSAPPPPAALPSLARGVVTMRCDLCSSSTARISLLVSGSAQTCFDDQMLEYCIKKELAQKGQLVSSIVAGDKLPFNPEMRRSTAVACGAPVVEVRVMTSTWVAQVLKQLASDGSFRSLVSLGIAGIHGFPVAGFGKEEADCLLSLRSSIARKNDILKEHSGFCGQLPSWLVPPPASRKRQNILSPRSDKSMYDDDAKLVHKLKNDQSDPVANQPASVASSSSSGFSLVAAMKPVYHVNQNRQMPFAGAAVSGAQSSLSVKVNLQNGPPGKAVRPNINAGPLPAVQGSDPPVGHSRHAIQTPSPAHLLPINVLPMKKHGCSRIPIHECSEEEFIKDVVQFLLSRGHSRLVPAGGIESFPDAILNGKRLDIYSLYKEVVSRGGFHVGNGINWKGQVFSNMRNHTLVNRMTGVGNTLKKHYETYLLEYELAHDDVDGECCILCHSSAPGDWVNCGICGEWAHFGCDRRVGLGAFKDYAKTDGLEYICPRCSATNTRGLPGRKKTRISAKGYT